MSRSPRHYDEHETTATTTRSTTGILRSFSPPRDRSDVSARLKQHTNGAGKSISEALAKGFELLLDQTMEGPLQQVFKEIDRRFSVMDSRLHDVEGAGDMESHVLALEAELARMKQQMAEDAARRRQETEEFEAVLKRMSFALAERDMIDHNQRKHQITQEMNRAQYKRNHDLKVRVFGAWKEEMLRSRRHRYQIGRVAGRWKNRRLAAAFAEWARQTKEANVRGQNDRIQANSALIRELQDEMATVLSQEKSTMETQVGDTINMHFDTKFEDNFQKHFDEAFFDTDAGQDLKLLQEAFRTETAQRHKEVEQINTVLRQIADVVNDQDSARMLARRHQIEAKIRAAMFRIRNRLLVVAFAEWKHKWHSMKKAVYLIARMAGIRSDKFLKEAFLAWCRFIAAQKKRDYVLNRVETKMVDGILVRTFRHWKYHYLAAKQTTTIINEAPTGDFEGMKAKAERERLHRIDTTIRAILFRKLKSVMARAFYAWKHFVTTAKRHRHIIRSVTGRWTHKTMSKAFLTWKSEHMYIRRHRHILERAAGRMLHMALARAWATWAMRTRRAQHMHHAMILTDTQKKVMQQDRGTLKGFEEQFNKLFPPSFDTFFSTREAEMMAGIEDMRELLQKIFSTASRQIEDDTRDEARKKSSPPRQRGGTRS